MLTIFLYTAFFILFISIALVFFIRGKKNNKNREFMTTWILVIISLVTGIILTEIVARTTAEKERSSIEQHGNIIAAAVNPERLKNLKGTLDDLKNPDYNRVRGQLIAIQKNTQNIRWLYLMSQNDSGFLFTLDNVPINVYGHVEPGQGYYEQPPSELSSVFTNGKSQTVGPYRDEWGTFVSCFSAISDSATGKVLMVLGVDVDASDWYMILFKARMVPMVITLLIVVLILLFSLDRDRILKSNRELLALQNDLIRKNNEIIEYTNMITHDLKRPVTGLKTILDILQKTSTGIQQADNNRIREMLTLGESSVSLMQRMLGDLLVAARLEWGNAESAVETVDMNVFIEELLNRSKIDFETAHATVTVEGGGVTNIDKKSFEILFSNLVGNALTYRRTDTEPQIHIAFHDTQYNTILSVKDNGRGIPEKDRPLIFNRFHRGSNVGECSGTGLGLYISKLAVDKMGGEITLNCPQEGGTEFKWILTKQ